MKNSEKPQMTQMNADRPVLPADVGCLILDPTILSERVLQCFFATHAVILRSKTMPL